jgi:hypothetical protein
MTSQSVKIIAQKTAGIRNLLIKLFTRVSKEGQTHTLHGLGCGYQSDELPEMVDSATHPNSPVIDPATPLKSPQNRCIINFADDFVPS